MVEIEQIKKVMEKLSFPEEAVICFMDLYDRFSTKRIIGEEFNAIFADYWTPEAGELEPVEKKLNEMAERYRANRYSLHMMFILCCSVRLHELYEQQGITEEIYWTGMYDIRCKLLECMECKGVPGTFVFGWFKGWFQMKRFGLGRFQYEVNSYGGGTLKLPCGHILNKGDLVFSVHIPSAGMPLTDEVRNASYQKAYEFLSKRYHTDRIVLTCGSWMLYPKHRIFMPRDSNILKFMDDFHISAYADREDFKDGWRIFGHYVDMPAEQWPEDSSLRRAYKKWMLDGNKSGDGWGSAVIENGINITHHNTKGGF